jgi:hypothetical protein
MAEAFSLSAVKDDCDLSELDLLLRLSRRGIELPPVGLGDRMGMECPDPVFTGVAGAARALAAVD